MDHLTAKDILNKKSAGEKITVLTAYDYPFSQFADQAGIDIILVGDSVANVVLGLDSTKEMTLDQMIYHSKAVRRGVERSLVVGDMPFSSYQLDVNHAAANAQRFVKEGNCDGVKFEWFYQCLEAVEETVKKNIPVMGHIGLTPQTADALGGFKVQGKDAQSAKKLIEQAKALEGKGCFSLVLECVPDKIAEVITKEISIPTIGIGAGPCCDGQVLVMHDLLGLFDRFKPKFSKQYLNLGPVIRDAIKAYCNEVATGKFPEKKHSFTMKDEEFQKLTEGKNLI